jgi:hypothetical protein
MNTIVSADGLSLRTSRERAGRPVVRYCIR